MEWQIIKQFSEREIAGIPVDRSYARTTSSIERWYKIGYDLQNANYLYTYTRRMTGFDIPPSIAEQ